jgi:PAS domain S-box-containing protein
VDDETQIRTLIGQILEMQGHHCTLGANAAEARKLLHKQSFDLILCDIDMPGESGLDFIRYALSNYQDTAAVMVTAMDDPVIAEAVLKDGVYDYIIKPFDQNGLLISVSNALRRLQLEIDNRAYRERLEKMVEERTAALQESEARFKAIFSAAEHVSFIMIDLLEKPECVIEFSAGAERLLGYSRDEILGEPATVLGLPLDITGSVPHAPSAPDRKPGFTRELILTQKSGKGIPTLFSTYPIVNGNGENTATLVVSVDISDRKIAERELQRSMEKLGKALEGSIKAIARTVETRDPYTAGHQQRVADLATAIAKEMTLSEDRIDGLRLAGVIHDLGKVAIPVAILNKPGRISKIELNLIKTHAQVGFDILKTIEFPWPIAQIVLQHHERMNGTGYPSGLSGDEILLEARILGVADVVEAMASHRPYRPALGIETALEEISTNKGELYDGEVVTACLVLFNEKGFQLT